jgi:predicted RNA-binding Zn ribbon-like protein
VKPLLLAGHPALEFLDTNLVVRGEVVDLIDTGRAFVDWLVDAGLVDAAFAASVRRRFTAVELDGAASEARKVRAWATGWIARWSAAPGARYDAELRRLDALLLRANTYRQVVVQGGELAIVERCRGDHPDELLGLVATTLADLVVREQAALVKRCAGADCTLWFVDRTKAHRRRFCSVAACGNRDKVAAFRERQRQRAVGK